MGLNGLSHLFRYKPIQFNGLGPLRDLEVTPQVTLADTNLTVLYVQLSGCRGLLLATPTATGHSRHRRV